MICIEYVPCWKRSYLLIHTALKRCSYTTEMLRLPGSSHAGSILGMPNIRSKQNKAFLAWMDKYVLEIEPSSPVFPLKRDKPNEIKTT